MLPNQRREKILELIREEGHAKVVDLSRTFKVTEVTIRQDLERLEKEGLVKREHGGAFLKNLGPHNRNITLENRVNLTEKAAIAKLAISYINEGDSIILDSGSTTTEIAKLILGYRNLKVLTNSLNIALLLSSNPGISLVLTGGEFNPSNYSLVGEKTVDFLHNINVDKLFLGTAGVSLRSGLSYPNIQDVSVKRAMIECAGEVFLVADSSKIGMNSFASLGSISEVNMLITDSGLSDKNKELLLRNNITFVTAEIPE